MLTDPQRDQLRQVLRPLQIIVAALAGVVVSFLVIALLLASQFDGGGQPTAPLLTYIAAGFAVVSVILWAVVPGLIARHARESILAGDVRRLAAVYQTRLIIGCALLEGIALFNLVAYMLERQPMSLMVAGVFLLILLSQFPTLDRMERWIEPELAAVEQLRQLGPPRGR